MRATSVAVHQTVRACNARQLLCLSFDERCFNAWPSGRVNGEQGSTSAICAQPTMEEALHRCNIHTTLVSSGMLPCPGPYFSFLLFFDDLPRLADAAFSTFAEEGLMVRCVAQEVQSRFDTLLQEQYDARIGSSFLKMRR